MTPGELALDLEEHSCVSPAEPLRLPSSDRCGDPIATPGTSGYRAVLTHSGSSRGGDSSFEHLVRLPAGEIEIAPRTAHLRTEREPDTALLLMRTLAIVGCGFSGTCLPPCSCATTTHPDYLVLIERDRASGAAWLCHANFRNCSCSRRAVANPADRRVPAIHARPPRTRMRELSAASIVCDYST